VDAIATTGVLVFFIFSDSHIDQAFVEFWQDCDGLQVWTGIAQ